MKQYRGHELKWLREKSNISGPTAAKLLNVKYTTYFAWENNQNKITDLAFETVKKKLEENKNDTRN